MKKLLSAALILAWASSFSFATDWSKLTLEEIGSEMGTKLRGEKGYDIGVYLLMSGGSIDFMATFYEGMDVRSGAENEAATAYLVDLVGEITSQTSWQSDKLYLRDKVTNAITAV